MSATTTPTTNTLIRDAQDGVDLASKAANSPALMAFLQQIAGTQIAAAQKNPLVSLGAGALVSVAAYWGVHIDGQTSTLLAIGTAILAGDISQWFAARAAAPVAGAK